jgi:hypothetical protein
MVVGCCHGDSLFGWGFEHFDDNIRCKGPESFKHFFQGRLNFFILDIEFGHSFISFSPVLRRIAANVNNPIKLIDVRTASKNFLSQIKFQNKRPDREHIYFLVVEQTEYNLQRSVPTCDHIISVDERIVLFGKTKIDQLYVKRLRIDEDVLGFDVSVHDAFLVEELERATDLEWYVTDFFVVEVTLSGLLDAFVVGNQVHGHVLKHEVDKW